MRSLHWAIGTLCDAWRIGAWRSLIPDRAERYLRHVGYYRLSPYMIPLQVPGRGSADGRQADSDFSLGWRGKVPVEAAGGVLLHARGVTGSGATVVQVVGVVKS